MSSGYTHFIIGLVAISTILCAGLNVLYGLTGLVSLGQVGFLAIGAYTVAILGLEGVSFWLALPAGALIAAIFGALLAVSAVRMAGPFLAMVTIAFAFIIEHSAIEWRGLTGGQNGLMGFPMPQVGSYVFSERDLIVLAILVAGLSLYGLRRLLDSTWGYAMIGLKDAEIAAQSLGYRPFIVKGIAFSVAAAMAGLAGGFFAPLMMFIAPSNFPFSQSILYLFAVILGGAGTVLGPLAGALVTVVLPELLSGLAEYRLLFFGALLVAVLLVAPRGIVGTIGKLMPATRSTVKATSLSDVEAWVADHGKRGTLDIADIAISFGGVQAVDGVSLEAKSGEVTSIIGPNGAGKTTVLNIASGFYAPDRGAIRIGETELSGKSADFAARHGVTRTYQTTRLFETMSVLDNVVAALPNGAIGGPFLPLATRENQSRAAGLLRYCGFDGDLDKRAGDLPHVDRRLVEIARSLATRPGIVLLDEPAAGLMKSDKQVLSVLLRKLADAGLAIVLVEHDMDLVMGLSDRILAMDSGRPIAFGTPDAVRNNPDVIAAYLGSGTSSAPPRGEPLQTTETPLLSTLDLTAGYGAAPVLKKVSMRVRPGEMVALLGANGAGKSTFLSAVSGLLRPVDGRIILEDQPIHEQAPHEIVEAGLVLVPEGRQVFPALTVRENIELGAYKRTGVDFVSEIDRLIARFPRLRDRIDAPAGLLSGGEQQMMAIARGLMGRPRVLLLDEPSLGLAPAMVDELYTVLSELRDDGVTILLVDQMATLALAVADYGYVLEQGEIVAQGPAEKLRNDESLIESYLGESGAAPAGAPAIEAV
ncbi:ATP-binding cassette domain-containing protein [Fulvimarina sp. MAC3]|uniref:branched-chain amino acid ABC transporter ATP-binding protein/permease n=1 Tax=Fulvimarina sp. MAC3 TaxID=3148887 RepID=UPI0031FBF255